MSAEKNQDDKTSGFLILEESILRLMGCPEEPSDPNGRLTHLLVQPTFFTPACVSFDVTKSNAVATLRILQRDQLNPLYSAFISKDREDWATFPLTPLDCHLETANVPGEYLSAAGNIGAFLDDSEMATAPGQHRDGIAYFFRIRGANSRDIWLYNPEPGDMPTHLGMLKSIQKISMATFIREPANSFLFNLFRGGRR